MDELSDLYIYVYNRLCSEVSNHPALPSLLGDRVKKDFDLIITAQDEEPEEDDVTEINMPYQPSLPPRIYLLPSSVESEHESSCNDKFTLQYSFDLEGFQSSDPFFYRICFGMQDLLRSINFGEIEFKEWTFPVLCSCGSGSYDFDAEHQTMKYSISFSVEVRIPKLLLATRNNAGL